MVDLNIYDQYIKLQEDENYYDQTNSMLKNKNQDLCSMLDSKSNIVEEIRKLSDKDIENMCKHTVYDDYPFGAQMLKFVINSMKDSEQLKLFQIERSKRNFAVKKIMNFYLKNQVKLNTLGGFNKMYDDYCFQL